MRIYNKIKTKMVRKFLTIFKVYVTKIFNQTFLLNNHLYHLLNKKYEYSFCFYIFQAAHIQMAIVFLDKLQTISFTSQ